MTVGRVSVAVAAALGIVLGLLRFDEGPAVAGVLRLVGYPTALVVIARFVPVVRQRRLTWFVAHEAGMAAICLGWALASRWSGVVVNGLWAVSAAVWYLRAGRDRTVSAPATP